MDLQYYSGDQIESKMSRECSTDTESRGAYRILVWKPEGKRPLGRPRRRWEDNIKMDLQYYSGDQIESKMSRECSTDIESRGAYRILVWKPEGKRPLGRPRRRWEDNIKMDLKEVGCGGMDWIEVAQDMDWWRTVVSAVMNFRVSVKCGEFRHWLRNFQVLKDRTVS